MSIPEPAAIRLHRARSWLAKARRAAANEDLDAEFIFLWIAFNALYGTPRYRPEMPSDEITDFTRFLRSIETVAAGKLAERLTRVQSSADHVVNSPFLDIECWRAWDRAGTRDRGERRATARPVTRKASPIERVYRQLYTLRNQLLHGAATDGGRRNRESLRHGAAILGATIPTLIELVEEHHSKIQTLEPVPYLPSIGEGGRFNAPRVHSLAQASNNRLERAGSAGRST